MKIQALKIPVNVRSALKEEAERRGITFKSLLDTLIADYVRAREAEAVEVPWGHGQKRVMTTFYISEGTLEAAKALAVRDGVAVNKITSNAIVHHLKNRA